MQERTCVQDVEAAALEVVARAVGAADERGGITLGEDALGVDFVANEMKSVFARKLGSELNLFREQQTAGGIVRAAEQERA